MSATLQFNPTLAKIGQKVAIIVRWADMPEQVTKVEVYGFETADAHPTTEQGWVLIGSVLNNGESVSWDTAQWSPGVHMLTVVIYSYDHIIGYWRMELLQNRRGNEQNVPLQQYQLIAPTPTPTPPAPVITPVSPIGPGNPNPKPVVPEVIAGTGPFGLDPTKLLLIAAALGGGIFLWMKQQDGD